MFKWYKPHSYLLFVEDITRTNEFEGPLLNEFAEFVESPCNIPLPDLSIKNNSIKINESL